VIAVGIPSALVLLLLSVSLAACGSTSREASAPVAAYAGLAGSAAPARPGATSSQSSPSRRVAPGPAGAAETKLALSGLATCLQRNGVSLPSASRSPTLRHERLDTRSAAYRRALAVCSPAFSAALRSAASSRAVSPSTGFPQRTSASGGPLRIPITAKLLAQERRFSACMRAQGVAAFPQPRADGGWDLAAAHLDTADPRFKSAESRCSSILDPYVPRRNG
jgi:hypothetical protein